MDRKGTNKAKPSRRHLARKRKRQEDRDAVVDATASANDMTDDAPAAADEAATAGAAATAAAAPTTPSVDPRPQHKEALFALQVRLKQMREDRALMPKKTPEERAAWKQVSKTCADMEAAFRAQCAEEVEAYLAGLSPEERAAEKDSMDTTRRTKKKRKVTRKRHALALKR